MWVASRGTHKDLKTLGQRRCACKHDSRDQPIATSQARMGCSASEFTQEEEKALQTCLHEHRRQPGTSVHQSLGEAASSAWHAPFFNTFLTRAEVHHTYYEGKPDFCAEVVHTHAFAKWLPVITSSKRMGNDGRNHIGLKGSSLAALSEAQGLLCITRRPALLFTRETVCAHCKICTMLGKWDGGMCRVPGCYAPGVLWRFESDSAVCCRQHYKKYIGSLSSKAKPTTINESMTKMLEQRQVSKRVRQDMFLMICCKTQSDLSMQVELSILHLGG
jgi:hypothetical protein